MISSYGILPFLTVRLTYKRKSGKIQIYMLIGMSTYSVQFLPLLKYRNTYNISFSKDNSSSTPNLIFEISLLLMFGSSTLSSLSSNLKNTITGYQMDLLLLPPQQICTIMSLLHITILKSIVRW
jgi:hypothetical protein